MHAKNELYAQNLSTRFDVQASVYVYARLHCKACMNLAKENT